MPPLVRQFVVLLVVLSQAMMGAHAGGIICWGGPQHEAEAVDVGCCHAQPGRPARLPAPVAPQHSGDEHQDCPCIDAAAPIARADGGPDSAPLPAAAPAPPCPPVAAAAALSRPWSEHRPPGPAPGLRTIRLLI